MIGNNVWRKIASAALWIVLLAAAISLAGCATSRDTLMERQWPSPPAAPRIRWVKEIRTYRDAGIGKGLWQRIMAAVTGEADPELNRPYGVMADQAGRLFIVDTAAAIVHVIDTKEGRYTAIGKETAVFRSPIAICHDYEGAAYITDSAAGQVYRYDVQEGALSPFIKVPLQRPTGIAWSSKKEYIYVTDTAAHQVVAFDRGGQERFRIGSHGDGPGQFHFPTDLFIDKTGRLFVTDALNARVQIFSPEGRFIRSFGQAGDRAGSFAKPKGIAVDSEGHIYVCDALLDTVQVFDDSGQLLLVFGSRGSGAGELLMPTGIHIDASDRIYVTDALNRRVQVFQYLKQPAGDRP